MEYRTQTESLVVLVLASLLSAAMIASCSQRLPDETSATQPTGAGISAAPSPSAAAVGTPSRAMEMVGVEPRRAATAGPEPQPTVPQLPLDQHPAQLVLATTDGEGITTVVDGVSHERRQPGVVSARLSPDGRSVAYMVGADPEKRRSLWVARTDDLASARQLVTAEGLAAAVTEPQPSADRYRWIESMAWSPDGRFLYFNHDVQPEDARPRRGGARPEGLMRLDVASGTLAELLPPERGGHFVLSPDGQHVAIARADGCGAERQGCIAFAQRDGRDWRVVLDHPTVLTERDVRMYAEPMWLPDSEALLVALFAPDADGQVRFNTESDALLYRVSVTGRAEQIGRAPRSAVRLTGSFWYAGSWSLDGQRLAYARAAADARPTPISGPGGTAYPPPLSTPARRELIIADADASDETVYTSAPGLAFWAWASGGRFLYNVRWRPMAAVSYVGRVRSARDGAGGTDRPLPVDGVFDPVIGIADGPLVLQTDGQLYLYKQTGELWLLAMGRGFDAVWTDGLP